MPKTLNLVHVFPNKYPSKTDMFPIFSTLRFSFNACRSCKHTLQGFAFDYLEPVEEPVEEAVGEGDMLLMNHNIGATGEE